MLSNDIPGINDAAAKEELDKIVMDMMQNGEIFPSDIEPEKHDEKKANRPLKSIKDIFPVLEERSVFHLGESGSK